MDLPTDFTTTNLFMVSLAGDDVVLFRPPQRMTKAQALNAVAYVATLARLEPREIEAARRAVEDAQ